MLHLACTTVGQTAAWLQLILDAVETVLVPRMQ